MKSFDKCLIISYSSSVISPTRWVHLLSFIILNFYIVLNLGFVSSSCQGNSICFVSLLLSFPKLTFVEWAVSPLPQPDPRVHSSELGLILEAWDIVQWGADSPSLHSSKWSHYWKIHWNEQLALLPLLACHF